MKKLVLLFLMLNFTAYGQQSKSKKAIIVLTYDDALASQLDIAIPQLDAAHLKGTFFLMGNINQITIPRWRAVSKNGHELANHTLYHPCLMSSVKGNPANNSANYTVYTMLREIAEMNNLLYAVDGVMSHTYAYPCTEIAVGGVNYVDSLRKSGLVKYARIGGGPDAVITDFKNLDPLQVPSWGVAADSINGDDLIAFVKKAQQKGGLGIFMFHGVGGDYLTTPALAHQQLLNYLQQHRDEVEVMTFQQAMDSLMGAKNN